MNYLLQGPSSNEFAPQCSYPEWAFVIPVDRIDQVKSKNLILFPRFQILYSYKRLLLSNYLLFLSLFS